MNFLIYFQLLAHYEIGTELLISFCHDNSTHIDYHIHEWWRGHSFIKAQISDEFLTDWLINSLQPCISKSMAFLVIQIEEKSINNAQKLDLVYSQSRMIYKKFPNAPRVEVDPTKIVFGPHSDGVIGLIVSDIDSQSTQFLGQNSLEVSSINTENKCPNHFKDVKAVQTFSSKGKQKPKWKKNKIKKTRKKGTNNANNSNNNSNAGGAKKENGKKMCFLLCKEDHLTYK